MSENGRDKRTRSSDAVERVDGVSGAQRLSTVHEPVYLLFPNEKYRIDIVISIFTQNSVINRNCYPDGNNNDGIK